MQAKSSKPLVVWYSVAPVDRVIHQQIASQMCVDPRQIIVGYVRSNPEQVKENMKTIRKGYLEKLELPADSKIEVRIYSPVLVSKIRHELHSLSMTGDFNTTVITLEANSGSFIVTGEYLLKL